ncbi:hypothetical protein [Bacillus subtilis]|uniref:hypothetical protein n=1 Tax=Bacillus subtilis TaxID=1423 RepID=UPI0016430234|nr:hypothetical protein [Bacillus subtilis]
MEGGWKSGKVVLVFLLEKGKYVVISLVIYRVGENKDGLISEGIEMEWDFVVE